MAERSKSKFGWCPPGVNKAFNLSVALSEEEVATMSDDFPDIIHFFWEDPFQGDTLIVTTHGDICPFCRFFMSEHVVLTRMIGRSLETEIYGWGCPNKL